MPVNVSIIVAVALSERAQLTLYMLSGIGTIIRYVLASLADEAVGERVMVGWGGGIVGVEAARWTGNAGIRGGSGVGAFWARSAGGRACRSGGRAGCSCGAI
jgi:hypothetical protein